MPEHSKPDTSASANGRPFPWTCPNCRRKEVRLATIPYQCQRFDNGQAVTVVVPALHVPKCGHCAELIFTYDTEEQINAAVREQADGRRNGTPSNGLSDNLEKSKTLNLRD